MNLLYFYTEVYGRLHNYKFIPYWLLTPLRRFVRKSANKRLPKYLQTHKLILNTNENDIIVSMTSFPARINDVWKVVDSLKNQSVKPGKIYLWLSKEQFPTEQDIPETLREREDEVFKIRMVNEDIRSYKKYYYSMQENPQKTVVTVDDDIYYHPKMIENLINASKKNPGTVVANIAKTMRFDSQGLLLPYAKWKRATIPLSSENNVQIGYGGVLYPAGSLDKIALCKDLFLKLAPMADDIWLNLSARIKGTPVVLAPRNILPLPILNEAPTLSSVNKGAEHMNDKQISNIREYLKVNGIKNVYDN